METPIYSSEISINKSFGFLVTDLKKFFFFLFLTYTRVPETLSGEILKKMHAPEKPDFPFANPKTLTEYDAFLFGIPTRFGNMPAQVKVRCCFFFAFVSSTIRFNTIRAFFFLVNRHCGMLLGVFGRKALLTLNMLACLYPLKAPVVVKKQPL